MLYIQNRYLLLSLCLAATTVTAQSLSLEEATQRASSFYAQSHHARAVGEGQPQLQLAHVAQRDGETFYYVFNNTATPAGSFVIVGGDERAREILAYGEDGLFDYDTAPDAFRWLLSQYEEQIHLAEPLSAAERQARQRTPKTAAQRTDVPKMTTTKWHLTAPYNCAIPTDPNKVPYQAGCVAVAMSQIMRTHSYPDHGQGYYEYEWKASTFGPQTFSADFENTYYDWDHMADSYTGKYLTDANRATCTLIYHAGVSVEMQYGKSGSGAYPALVPYGLATYFRYNPSVSYLMREYYSDQEWEDYLYRELSAHRCVLYGGDNSRGGGGHAFVLDGYNASKDMYSVNWGYSSATSTSNYVSINGTNALYWNTSNQYNANQAMVLNITPDAAYHELHVISYDHYQLFDAQSQEIESATVNTRVPQQFSLRANMLKLSMLPCNIQVGVMAVNTETGETFFGCQDNTPVEIEDYDSDEVVQDIPFSSSFITTPGTYQLFPAYREVGSTQWHKVAVPLSRGIRTLTVEGEAITQSLDLAMTAAQWRTLALPFSAEVPAGLTAYQVTGIEDQRLLLQPVTQLDADQGYLLHGPQGLYTFIPHSSQSIPHSSLLIPNSSFASIEASVGSFVLQNHAGRVAFYRVETPIQVPQYSAYLVLSEGTASQASYRLGDDAAALHSTSVIAPLPTTPGFHIYRGRVIFVK